MPGTLVTRPQPGAAATAARLAALGRRPVLAPALAIRSLRPNTVPDPVQAVVIASANALPGLPAGLRRTRLFCVGDATAAAAAAAGFCDVASADGDAAALAALCGRGCDPTAGPLLLGVGAGQGGALAASLREIGFAVEVVTLYAAVPVPALPAAAVAEWRAGTLAAALFLSAETALSFVRLAAGEPDGARGIEALAIGGAAAAALAPLPWRAIRVAVRPTQDAVLALLT